MAWGHFVTVVLNFLIIAFVLFVAIRAIDRTVRNAVGREPPLTRAGRTAHANPRPAEVALNPYIHLMAAKPERRFKVVADNRKARFHYEIGESFEAGIALTGSEVKSLRAGKATIAESYADARGGEIWLINSNIPEYLQAARFNHRQNARASCCCTSARSTSLPARSTAKA